MDKPLDAKLPMVAKNLTRGCAGHRVARRAVHGPDKVARAMAASLKKLVPRDLTNRMDLVNGQPGVVSHRNGRPYAVVTLDIEEVHIKSIYIVSNPEKLAHLLELPALPC